MPLILIVDADRATVDRLQLALGRYETIFAADGAAALHQVCTEKPDLVMLELELPDVDGLLLIGKIREASSAPIIVCSARQAQADRVLALRHGADDVIAKPFDLDEFNARVEAVLRRSNRVRAHDDLHVGALSISDRRGARVNGTPLRLTPTEHRLLLLLVEQQGEVVTREFLAEHLWGVSDASAVHALAVHLKRLRGRLWAVLGAARIVTVRGQGLRIQEDKEDV